MPIVSGATTVMDIITGTSFIVLINEALYYVNKLNHSLINPNQLRCYETMVWDNPFDLCRVFCIKTGDGNTIDLTPDGTKIRFSSHVPTDKELRTLPHIEVTSGSEWNPHTVKLGKDSMDKNDDTFELQLHVFGYHTTHTGKCSYSDNQKLRMLNRKINAYFLQATKSSIKLELAITPVNLSYYDALAAFRNQVNQKYPPELSTSNNIRS